MNTTHFINNECSLYLFTGYNFYGDIYGPFNIGQTTYINNDDFPDNETNSVVLISNGPWNCVARFYNVYFEAIYYSLNGEWVA